MARLLDAQFVLIGRLIAETPLAVGGPGGDDVNLPLAENGRGELYIPGTGLTGPIRSWARRAVEKSLVSSLFGPWTDAEDHTASWLRFEEARVDLPGNVTPELRDGVGIDRNRGAASKGIRFEREVLPVGTAVALRVVLDIPRNGDPFDEASAKAFVGKLIGALAQSRIRLGAGKTRGLGRVKLEEWEVRRADLRTRRGLCDWLRERPPLVDIDLDSTSTDHTVEVDIQWRPVGSLLVKSGIDGLDIDMLPVVGSVDEKHVVAVLPGSSVKGALRSHAERIARTLLDRAAPTAFLDQIADGHLPVVCHLFGSRERAGALCVDDVYQDKTRRRRLSKTFYDDIRLGKTDALGDWGERQDHVAINRFTGGAHEGALYSLLAPKPDDWQDIRMNLDVATIPASHRLAALALFLYVLRDLAQGELALGFGKNRGCGAVKVNSVRIASHGVEELPGTLTINAGGAFSGLPDNQRLLLAPLAELLRATESQASIEGARP